MILARPRPTTELTTVFPPEALQLAGVTYFPIFINNFHVSYLPRNDFTKNPAGTKSSEHESQTSGSSGKAPTRRSGRSRRPVERMGSANEKDQVEQKLLLFQEC